MTAAAWAERWLRFSTEGGSLPNAALVAEFERARAEHDRVSRALIPLVERVAVDTIADVLAGTHTLEVHGEINEDWLAILRIQRVLDADGGVLFDIESGHDDRVVEDAIDTVNTEYLDLLVDLTGDEYMGTKTIER